MSTERPVSRRTVLGIGAAAAVPLALSPARAAAAPAGSVEELEARYGVQVGLVARNLSTGRRLAHRETQRFPLLSTFKVLATAAVLRHERALDRTVAYRSAEVVENSPVTTQRRRMSVVELMDAALRYSDNTAGNLLLRQIGGPPGLTRFVRRLGDHVTRLDRWEPDLNDAVPGDVRDTTTPESILTTYRHILLGDVLSTDRRWLLRGIMQGNTTSVGKFREALPAGWWFADKTGGGAYGTQNDVGLITRPDGTEIAVAVLSRSDDRSAVANPQLMVDVGRLVVGAL